MLMARDGKTGKVPVSARVPATVTAALDRMASAMRPRPTRSQMVAMALEDWVQSRSDADKRATSK
jgi:predicted transcriptional regulator